MTLHLKKCLDLAQRKVFAIAQCNQLVKCAEQFISIAKYFSLIQAFAYASDNLRKEMERVDVLQDIRLSIGDEYHVKLVKGLVDIANIVLLNSCMLCA